MSDVWSLYNSKSKQMRENLSIDDFRGFIQSLHRDEQRFWFAWNGLRDSWEPALDILLEVTRPNLSTKNHEPVNNASFVEMEYQADEKQAEVPTIDLSEPENHVVSIVKALPKPPLPVNKEEALSGFDRRRYPRYHARFRVIIKNENLTFRTFSMDVSLGGLAIETAVPPGCVGSLCQLILGNPMNGENILFSAKMLVTRVESKYFSFIKTPPENIARLQKWLSDCEPLKRVS